MNQNYQTGGPDIESVSGLNVSSPFLNWSRMVLFNRLMPETLMARHVIGLNHAAIGHRKCWRY